MLAQLAEQRAGQRGGDRAGDTGRVLCWLTVPGEDYRAAVERDIDITVYSRAELDEVVAADLLEDVTGGTGDDGFEQRLVVGVRGEHEALHLGHAAADLTTQLDAVAIGQAHVEDRHIGLHGEHASEAGLDRIRFADDFQITGRVDQGPDALTHDLVVVDQEHTDAGLVAHLAQSGASS